MTLISKVPSCPGTLCPPCGLSMRSLHRCPCPLPCIVPSDSYRDEAAVQVEALAAALGHHDADAQGPVCTSCQGEEQHMEARVGGQAEELAAVIVPVGRGQWARTGWVPFGGRGLQPVGSTARERLHSEERSHAGWGGRNPRGL